MTSFLNQYKRQVKLNIDLPSSGQFYPEGTLRDGKATGLPVFGMTANDEITIKTPDALFSGSATVEVIKSCVPDILDPWKMPTIDLDFVLGAIRIATYGETISMKVTCPHCKQQHEMDYNLQGMLDSISSKVFTKEVEVKGLRFGLRPLNYKTQTDLSIELFTTQRQLAQIPKEWDEQKKNDAIKELVRGASEVNIKTILGYIDSIADASEAERNPEEIKKFLVDADTEFFTEIKKTVEGLKKEWDSRTIKGVCTNEECSKEFQTNFNMDYSSFFGIK